MVDKLINPQDNHIKYQQSCKPKTKAANSQQGSCYEIMGSSGPGPTAARNWDTIRPLTLRDESCPRRRALEPTKSTDPLVTGGGH